MLRVLSAVVLVGAAVGAPGSAARSDGPIDTTPLPAPATRVRLPARSFSVAAAGDWLSEGAVNNAARAVAPPGVRYDHEPLVRAMVPMIQQADLAICQMETPIGVPGAAAGGVGVGPYGTNLIAAPYEVAGDLRRMGFDRCATASNHAYDLGAGGIASTLDALDAAGITHTGTARSPAGAVPQLLTINGVKVAHLAFARNSNTGWTRDPWRIRPAVDASYVVADVAAARAAGAEVVIVSLHVYIEMQYGPSSTDRALVQQIVAAAHPDLILITGPHVVQPIERVGGTLVFWSLGNFMSGMGVSGRGKYSDLRTLDSLFAFVRFTERAGGGFTTDPWPLLVCESATTRRVYPGLTTIYDPTITATLRAQLSACINRSTPVVAGLH